MIKNILPFENLIYKSSLSKDELIQHIKKELETKNSYSGKVLENNFRIKREINYRNSFLPVITGEIFDSTNGSKIMVKMRLILFVQIFISIWLSGVFLAIIFCVVTIINDNSASLFILSIPSIMFVVGCTMTVLAFKYESKKSNKDLEVLLHAKRVEF